MSVLSFTLSEEGVNCLREAITCLNKFHDEVSFEAHRDKFKLSAMNPTKSAYACISFNTARFFAKYRFSAPDKFLCRLYSRVLIAIFRGRAGSASFAGADATKDPAAADSRAATIDHCTVTVEDGPTVKSRFVVTMAFRNGCVATHRLTFESAPVVHARFNANEAMHRWAIASRTLRQIMEHFGPGVELLDINSTSTHLNFNCYTEKALNADEVLKKPLQTSIAVDLDEFHNIEVEEGLHVVVSVRDFRAVVQHAGLIGADLRARYSVPERPIRFSYDGDAMACEFLLMTVGERSTAPGQKQKRKTTAPVAPEAPVVIRRGSERTATEKMPVPDRIAPGMAVNAAGMAAARANARDKGTPQPAFPAVGAATAAAAPSSSAARAHMSFFDIRPQQSQVATRANLQAVEDGLFVGDDGWKPVRVDDDEEEDQDDGYGGLGWDDSERTASFTSRRCMGTQANSIQTTRTTVARAAGVETQDGETNGGEYAPTQVLSDVQKLGLFYGI